MQELSADRTDKYFDADSTAGPDDSEMLRELVDLMETDAVSGNERAVALKPPGLPPLWSGRT